MVSISYQKQLPFTASQLFDLVADIESYPDFLPYCLDLKLKSEQIRAGKRVRVAQIYVGYKLIKESFTTQVIEDEETYIISSSLISGPFSHLENKWQFEPRDVGEGAFVSLNLTYQFSNKVLEKLTGAAFERFFNQFAEAFEKRAYALYKPLSL